MNDERPVVIVPANHSPSLGALAGALAKAQGEIKGAAKDSENPFFKSRYADLASVWDACRKPLADNKLAVIQLPKADNDGVTVTTILAHESGEWISEALTLPLKDQTPQAVGSALTYARRYGLSAVVGIAPEDDDAEGAMPARPSTGNGSHAPESKPLGNYISEPQGNRLKAIARSAGWKEQELDAFLAKKGYASVLHVPKGQYDAICKAVEQGTF
jgi:hypothetical protein